MRTPKKLRLTWVAVVTALFIVATLVSSSGNPGPVNAGPVSASPPSPPVAFDQCLQDDADPTKVLVFNSQNGNYVYCCGGTQYSGTGLVKIKGKVVCLTHNPVGRKLVATVDSSTHRGTASLQFPHATVPCIIIDRNTTNNTCTCGVRGD